MSGRYELARHFGAWTVIDHANYDAERPIYLSRAQADSRCRQLNQQQTTRTHPTPTLFDKDPEMTEPAAQPSIWDEFDDGDFRRVPDGEVGAGSPLIIPEGGGDPVRYMRATHYIGAVEDDIGIQQWKRNLTLDGAKAWTAEQWAAWDAADWKGKKALAHQAFVDAGGEVASKRGTHMHGLSDILDDGGDVPATPEEMSDIIAYQAAVRHFTLVHAEVKTVCDELQVAGTPDRIWAQAQWHKNRIGDLKTGKIDGRKCAMQLALYAHSRLYDIRTGERTDLDVDQQVGVIIHLPYGEAKARVLEVDLEAGWRGVLLCREVYAWRKVNGLTKPWKAPLKTLMDAIAEACSDTELKALWTTHKDTWADAHTAAAKTRLAALGGAEVAA